MNREERDVCERFEQYVDIATDIVEFRFSDGTVKRAKRGLYMRDIEKSIRKMLIDQMANKKKQEPCDDCISRQAVIDTIDKCVKSMHVLIALPANEVTPLFESIHQLPPVTPQPKMGKWKAFTHSAYHGNDEDGEPIWREVTVYHCNLCNRRTVIKEKYCPNCGAKMQEVEG